MTNDLLLLVEVQTTSTVQRGFTMKELSIVAPAKGSPAVAVVNLGTLTPDGAWDEAVPLVQQRIEDVEAVAEVKDEAGNITTSAVPASIEAAMFIDVMMKAIVPASHPAVQQMQAAGVDTSNLSVWEFGKAVLHQRLQS